MVFSYCCLSSSFTGIHSIFFHSAFVVSMFNICLKLICMHGMLIVVSTPLSFLRLYVHKKGVKINFLFILKCNFYEFFLFVLVLYSLQKKRIIRPQIDRTSLLSSRMSSSLTHIWFDRKNCHGFL